MGAAVSRTGGLRVSLFLAGFVVGAAAVSAGVLTYAVIDSILRTLSSFEEAV